MTQARIVQSVLIMSIMGLYSIDAFGGRSRAGQSQVGHDRYFQHHFRYDFQYSEDILHNSVVDFSPSNFVAKIDTQTIPAGVVFLGCVSTSVGMCDADEHPAHAVVFMKGFVMMETEVTQDLYQRIMGRNPSQYIDEIRPVEQVSWYDAVYFANALNISEGRQPCYTFADSTVMWEELCTGWRLPTEAEWEYAAQGGEYYVFAGSDDIDEVGWYEKNSANVTHPVKQKKPNHYGLYDMSGNVWEWCWDWYSADQYISSQETFRRGPDSGVYRVFRGGSWNSNLRNTRIANRNYYMGQSVDNFLGFRLVRSL